MTDAFATVDGHRLSSLRVFVANVGPWYAECVFEEAPPELEGAVVIKLRDTELRGTVSDTASGTFGMQRSARVVGGAGSWSNICNPKSYHNDAGVKARLVAEDAAREVGETIATFVPEAERLGTDYVRDRHTASRTLLDAAGNAAWWVDYAGLTHVGPRAAAVLDSKAYTLVAYDPVSRIATLGVDDPAAIAIGMVIAEGLDVPATIREFDVRVDATTCRVSAWCGGSELEAGRLAGLLGAIARHTVGESLYGLYRYRVIAMAPDGRVKLQAVRKGAGLPDIQPIAQWPGVAGVHAELAPGAEVLVEFVEGDRTMPIVTHYAGLGGVGFVPVSLVLGGADGPPAARQGDAVEVLLPPAVFSGTVGGAPASGVLTFPLVKTLGIITAGSSRVRVAT